MNLEYISTYNPYLIEGIQSIWFNSLAELAFFSARSAKLDEEVKDLRKKIRKQIDEVNTFNINIIQNFFVKVENLLNTIG